MCPAAGARPAVRIRRGAGTRVAGAGRGEPARPSAHGSPSSDATRKTRPPKQEVRPLAQLHAWWKASAVLTLSCRRHHQLFAFL
ncbi:hypothetical protein GCM10010280_65800 [Streptomyces pilosus]|uniref:Uncharacterized protein n=1 Tax=Streptomyces pilosus TaxID=28893 RepID=A0A918F6A8_9ACTN|nr:hypothetical protein GCM10010280_65800 [Streptomyces pilosus]